MDENVKTLKEEHIDSIGDMVIPEDVLYTNNTFNLNALNETLERLSLINFWSLYQTQRSRLKIMRFDIPFSEFQLTYRLVGEETSDFYPKRYIAYVDYAFIESELRRSFRNSEFYNKTISQEQIASNPTLFRHNHMVFVDGEYIFTTEVYPMESRTGIIIDVETNRNDHGIKFDSYQKWLVENPTVTILMVPNFSITTLNTNNYVLDMYKYKVPFSKIPGSEKFTSDTICFVNCEDGLGRRFLSPEVKCNPTKQIVEFGNDLQAGAAVIRLCFITFDHVFGIYDVTSEEPFIQVRGKMPCPKEHLFVTVKGEDNKFKLRDDVSVTMYYPNIYGITGLNDGECARIVVMQDEDTVTESEAYVNELAKYEQYIEMLPKYKDESISEIIKRYRPSSFVYSIEDYEGSVYVPNTLNYKVQKLHKTIYENPWALVVYLDILNLPSDKFYLDMEKLDLAGRVRRDTTLEELDSGIIDQTFDEDMYVFAMNRHFVDTRSYGFRIFIDGLFQLDSTYRVLPGPDFYYIYIPVSKITPTTMIEIERYKLFSIERVASTDSLDKPLIEFDFSQDRQMIGYTREIYVAYDDTLFWLHKKYIRIEVLYYFGENSEKWVTIPTLRNVPMENKVRVYLTREEDLGKKFRIGIQRRMYMQTGNVIDEDSSINNIPQQHRRYDIPNSGGHDRGNYRVFNNGRCILPIQYYVQMSMKYGGTDFIRTACDLHAGDQFTIDEVPAQFRVVYYQHEIDEVNKKGYVDLDGKIKLPISLKWYDIYLDGRKLHKKNIEIISPTRFYVQGVESRLHLMIVVKNRDPEIFHLPYVDWNMEPKPPVDWNNTVMDDLMDEIDGLKKVIDDTKQVIDPNNEFPDIATGVAKNINAIIFFYEFFLYTFINANKKQITQSIKDAFPNLVDEQGIMAIDANEGAIKDPSIGGYLIKLIECNIAKGAEDMFTDENVNYDGIGALQDRFAIRPLDTDKHEFALKQEFMTDPGTAEPAIRNEDGTITAINMTVRLNHNIEEFSNNITLYGMGRANIYHLTFDNEYKTYVYTPNTNMLTEEIELPKKVKKLAVAVNITMLTEHDGCKMLTVADVDPVITIQYRVDDVAKEVRCRLTRLKDNIIEEDKLSKIVITSIVLQGIPDTVKTTFAHSILLAF